MNASWQVEQADVLDALRALPEQSVDLVFGSPPYEKSRAYLEDGVDLNIARDTDAWVSWMVEVVKASLRVCKGLVAYVVEGQTKDYRYSCGPLLLMADLHRAGVCLRKPPIYHRVGIPGSGGPDWLRNDWEPIVCCTNGGRLPWSDNTSMGHPPKWKPGGAMSHRTQDGERVSALCGNKSDLCNRGGRNKDGTIKKGTHKRLGRGKCNGTEGSTKGSCMYKLRPPRDGNDEQVYLPPALANPGNVISCSVGGGQMGSPLSHANEAPFPEALAEFFIRSFCPPGGLCLDPFAGSGTTLAVAVRWGRRALGYDLRASQVALSRRRLEGERTLFDVAAVEEPQS